jgi:Tetratricopeptide repeat
VFDNAADLDVLRSFVPAGGAGQVVVTSNRRSAEGLGVPVPVEVFSDGEAVAFLAERAGLDDEAGARELAGELGFLPLGLAQAAALIAREHVSYGTYLGRLRALPVAHYLRRAEGDAYPYRLAEAILLSVRAVETRDPSGVRIRLMGLVAVLAETGVPRRLLYLAAAGVSGDGRAEAVEVDAGVGDLADASLLGFTADDESVVAHRLVMRVVRERLAVDGRLSAVLDDAVRVLAGVAGGFGEAWRDPAGVRDLAGQVSAVVACLAAYPDVLAGEMPAGLPGLRLRSVYLLNMLGDSTGLAILAAEPLAADCGRLLGTNHPDTLSACANLAYAYRAAGRTAEAIPLYERTLADFERVLGADHPDTKVVRGNLAALMA